MLFLTLDWSTSVVVFVFRVSSFVVNRLRYIAIDLWSPCANMLEFWLQREKRLKFKAFLGRGVGICEDRTAYPVLRYLFLLGN